MNARIWLTFLKTSRFPDLPSGLTTARHAVLRKLIFSEIHHSLRCRHFAYCASGVG